MPRPWEFTGADIFRVSRFQLEVGKELRVEIGPADLGHRPLRGWRGLGGADSARGRGTLTSRVNQPPETIAHVWLRFHPKEIARLFPPETVFADGATNLLARCAPSPMPR